MTSEPEHGGGCCAATGGIEMSRLSTPPEAALPTVAPALQNADNLHCTVQDTDAWPVGIDDLPDEILLKILSHMSFSELINVVQKVCTRWRRLSQDSELWTDKEYEIRYWKSSDSHTTKGDTTDQVAMRTFCNAPSLRRVHAYRGAKSCVFRALYNNCHRLSELNLHPAQKLSYSVLKNLVEKCSGIHTLTISAELLTSERFSEAVSRLAQLRVLEVQPYSTETIPTLRPLVGGCPQLAEVDFNTTVLNVDELRHFLSARRHTLVSIRINWTMLGKKCITPLLAVCADTLERLELYSYDVLNEEAREAFTALGELKTLRELVMKITERPPPGAAALAFKTGGLSRLRVLELRQGYSLDDATLIAVSRGCPVLQTLYVADAEQLSDAAFSQIHRLKHLEILDVSHCTGLGGALIPHLARLPRLHTLLLEGLEFPKLRPGVAAILQLSGLRRLSLGYSLVTGVPFDKFPGKLVSLRRLKILGCRGDPKATDGLTEQMPDLEIEGTIRAEEPTSVMEDQEIDGELEEEENEDNAGPGDADEVRDDCSGCWEGGDGDSERDDAIWDESSLPILFLEDV